jgi:hypothetical protein
VIGLLGVAAVSSTVLTTLATAVHLGQTAAVLAVIGSGGWRTPVPPTAFSPWS